MFRKNSKKKGSSIDDCPIVNNYDHLMSQSCMRRVTNIDVLDIAEVRASLDKDRRSYTICNKVRRWLYDYWEICLALILPLISFGLLLKGDSLIPMVATISAAMVAGMVSMIVLHENRKIEELKLDEKWIFYLTEQVSEIIILLYSKFKGANSVVSQKMSLSTVISRSDDYKKIQGNDELKAEVLGAYKNEVVSFSKEESLKLERFLLMLRGNSRAELLHMKYRMAENAYDAFRVIVDNDALDGVAPLSRTHGFFARDGVYRLSNETQKFMKNELKRSKKGSPKLRRRIRAFYVAAGTTLLCFCLYVWFFSTFIGCGKQFFVLSG